MSEFRRYVRNAMVLVGASLLMRTVSLAFNAYVSRCIGAAGMGLFSLVMSVYTFAVTFATSGIQLAVTRLCAEADGRHEPGRVLAVLRQAVFYALCFGGAASLLLFFLARPIGLYLLCDARTIPSLRLLSLSLVPIALSSVFAGYFTAMRRVQRHALSQLFEQAVRILLTVTGLLALAPLGLEYATLALVGGSSLAEFSSAVFRGIAFWIDRKRHFRDTRVARGEKVLRPLLGAALPIAASTYIRSGLLTVEHVLIPRCLSAYHGGYETALASYGVLHSMALPVVLFPAAVSGTFSSLLVTEMAACAARGERRRIRYMTERAVVFTLLYAIGCAGVILALSDEIGVLFYHSEEAGAYIRALAPVIPIMYLDTTVDNILKGLGQQVYSMGINIADSALSILLVCLLLPRYGAMGYAAVIILTEICNFSLSLLRLQRVAAFALPLRRALFAPLLAAVGASALGRLLLPQCGTSLTLAGHLLLLPALYLLLCALLGSLTRADYRWLRTLLPAPHKRQAKAPCRRHAKEP